MGGTATYWKASLMLCFWLSETSTIQINQSRATAEMNATGVVYTPGVCRGRIVPSRTLFGVHYILTGVGIQTLFVHWLGCGRPQIAGRAGEDTPLFVWRHIVAKTPLTYGCQSELIITDRCLKTRW